MVRQTAGSEVSEKGGRGSGRALSDHSAVVGDRLESSCHRLCLKYLGCNPNTSLAARRAVLVSVSLLLASFTDVSVLAVGISVLASPGIELIADLWFTVGGSGTRRFVAVRFGRVSLDSIGHKDGRVEVGETGSVSKEGILTATDFVAQGEVVEEELVMRGNDFCREL